MAGNGEEPPSPPTISVAFVFAEAVGHINPSLPLSRALVRRGAAVHYLCHPHLRGSIEATGASFHSVREWQTEFYRPEDGDNPEASADRLAEEVGATADKMGGILECILARDSTLTLAAMPGTVRWLKHVNARRVVFDPLLAGVAGVAARHLGVPSCALLTTAGPGSVINMFAHLSTDPTFKKMLTTFKPHLDAVAELNAIYNLDPPEDVWTDWLAAGQPGTLCNLVTTTPELADPIPQEAQEWLLQRGVWYQYVGPLLDDSGAQRGCAFPQSGDEALANVDVADEDGEQQAGKRKDQVAAAQLLQASRDAKAEGRRVAVVSLGTGINQQAAFGQDLWDTCPEWSTITGREACQSVFRAAFDALGVRAGEPQAWFIAVNKGNRPDALEGVEVPENAMCLPHIPQLELLRDVGVDMFLTHGGQNSFMESMAAGTPVVVCPMETDQPQTAQRAVTLGVGLKVDRPNTSTGNDAVAAYRHEIAAALRQAVADGSLTAKAQEVAKGLKSAGGVPAAVEAVMGDLEAVLSGND